MAWVTPTDVAPGDAILASLYNQDVVENVLESRVFFASARDTAPRTYSSISTGAATQVTTLDLAYSAKVADSLIVLQAQLHVSTNVGNRIVGGVITQGASIISNYQADTAGNTNRLGAGSHFANNTTEFQNIYMTAVYAPGNTTSITYGVQLINASEGTQTLYLNRDSTGTTTASWSRAVSTLFLWEVAP